jgi:hypothetical protein
MSPSTSEPTDDAELRNVDEILNKVEAEYAILPRKTTKKPTEKQLENLRKMRESKIQKSKEKKAKKQEEEYINKILTEKEDVLLARLRDKLKKEGRDIDVIDYDEPVKPRSTRKPPKEYTYPSEPPKPKEPEAPEPQPVQKPVNPFMHLF